MERVTVTIHLDYIASRCLVYDLFELNPDKTTHPEAHRLLDQLRNMLDLDDEAIADAYSIPSKA